MPPVVIPASGAPAAAEPLQIKVFAQNTTDRGISLDSASNLSARPNLVEWSNPITPSDCQQGGAVKYLYAGVIGFVGVSMLYLVDQFEPNRVLARILTALIYLTGALAIVAKLG